MLVAEDLAPEDESRRAAKRRLVEETRRLVEEVALLDAAGGDEDDLVELAEHVAALTKELSTRPSFREHGGLYSAPGFASKLAERSPISGLSNPLAAPMRIWLDGDVTRAQATYGPAHEGPPGSLHGGVVAGAFDELLGIAQMASGIAGFTGTISVRMLKPTPLRRLIDYEGGVDRVEGRKIHAWGRSSCEGDPLAEAECIFISSEGR